MYTQIDLSNCSWHLWLDTEAKWLEDPLFAPGTYTISSLPVNPPTIGWDALYEHSEITAHLPATVESYFGTDNAWMYHGVSWIYTTVEVPADIPNNNHRCSLHIERSRLRAEIFVNRTLCGYDAVAETPYDVDITAALHPGTVNEFAVRITNPGGTRGWNDIVSYYWGEKEMLPGHDFAYLGKTYLESHCPVSVQDVFVKNLLPAGENNIEVIAEIFADAAVSASLTVEIAAKENMSQEDASVLLTETFPVELAAGLNTVSRTFSVPAAKLWDMENPNLYQCTVSVQKVSAASETTVMDSDVDARTVTFGFRVLEVREANGCLHYYINGKRFRHKSAIDWGYYALTGTCATEEMARKSVQAAKDIGHTGINFHRQIGDPVLMDQADELGLYLYEEPGGLKSGDMTRPTPGVFVIEKNPLAMDLMREKLTRMIRRDRNHPSLVMYSMSNEDKIYSDYRAEMLKLCHDLDGTRFARNASGTNGPDWEEESDRMNASELSTYRVPEEKILRVGAMHTYNPYQGLTQDSVDIHTVGSLATFQEDILGSHYSAPSLNTRYWGEVGCYCGPANWYKVMEDFEPSTSDEKGFDRNNFEPMHDKLVHEFEHWNLEDSAGGRILDPEDVSLQCGRGLMYIDGRFDQVINSYDACDGYAINGWSSGPQVGAAMNAEERFLWDWDSAIVDEGRNLKGPAEDYAYYTRPCQVALFRNNGKYFGPDETVEMRAALINEGILPAGRYHLHLRLTDTAYQVLDLPSEAMTCPDGTPSDGTVQVLGGDIFAQELGIIRFTIPETLAGGHISLEAVLVQEETADRDPDSLLPTAVGQEQVLFTSFTRYSYALNNVRIAAWNAPEAAEFLKNLDVASSDFATSACTDPASTGSAAADTALDESSSASLRPEVIVAGAANDTETFRTTFAQALQAVKEGSTLILPFDKTWAALLYRKGLLSQMPTEWGCEQIGFWYGNGWGYVGAYAGDNIIPSGNVLPTNGWQPKGDPNGFYPFESDLPLSVDGLWMARPDVLRVTLAELSYEKGRILLNAAYPFKSDDPLSALMLVNMILDE